MDGRLPGSSVRGNFQARVLEWGAISFSRGSSWARDRTHVSCIVGRCFTIWATREVPSSQGGGKDKPPFICPLQSLKVKVKLLSCVWLFVTPWIVAYQVLPSMGFSRQEYWSGLPLPSPGDLPDPVIEPGSPTLQADAFTIWATREAHLCY